MSHYCNIPGGKESDEDRARISKAKTDFVLAGHDVDEVGIGYGGGPDTTAGKMIWCGSMHMAGQCKRCGKILFKDAYRNDDRDDWGAYFLSHYDEKRKEVDQHGYPTSVFDGLGECR